MKTIHKVSEILGSEWFVLTVGAIVVLFLN